VPDVATDAWRRPSACAAACSDFALAAESPVLRPSSSRVVERWAAALEPGVTAVPRHAVEEVMAALSGADVARLTGLAEQFAAERWGALVDDVGVELAREPLLVGVATAAISELVPPPRWLVAMREATSDEASGPVNVLASLLHPESVWSATWRPERAGFVARPVVAAIPIPEAPSTSRQLAHALELIGQAGAAQELCQLLLLSAVPRRDGLVPVAPSHN
jgi:hypothetical protein